MHKKIIQRFKENLTNLGYSKSTQNMLPSCVSEFLNHTNKDLDKINKVDVLNYYNYLQNRPNKRGSGGLSESYINHHIYALKLFFSYQLEVRELVANPMSTLVFPTPKSMPRPILCQKEIKELFRACETSKERAILSFCYGLGLRCSELVNLTLKDVHFKTKLLYVREGKNKKRRVVPMNQIVAKNLKNYLKKERKPSKQVAFILNAYGNPMRGDSLNKALKKILGRTTIQKEITLHCLRHSIATHLLENGLSVEFVRDFLGHKHLESTQIYTRLKNRKLWTLNSI